MESEKHPIDYDALAEAVDRLQRRNREDMAKLLAFLMQAGLLQVPNVLEKQHRRAGRRRAETARRGPLGQFLADGEEHEDHQTEDAGN